MSDKPSIYPNTHAQLTPLAFDNAKQLTASVTDACRLLDDKLAMADNESVNHVALISTLLHTIADTAKHTDIPLLYHLCMELADYQELLCMSPERHAGFINDFKSWLGELEDKLTHNKISEFSVNLFKLLPEQRLRSLYEKLKYTIAKQQHIESDNRTSPDIYEQLLNHDDVHHELIQDKNPADEINPAIATQATTTSSISEGKHEPDDFLLDDTDDMPDEIITDTHIDNSAFISDLDETGNDLFTGIIGDDGPIQETYLEAVTTDTDNISESPNDIITDENEIARMFGVKKNDNSNAGLGSADLAADEMDNDDDLDISALFAADDDVPNPEDLFAVLAAELNEISITLSSLANEFSNPDRHSQSVCVDEYTQILQRLMTASEAMRLSSLQSICEFISNNLTCAHTLAGGRLQELTDYLLQWPPIILEYLRNPGNDDISLKIIELLQAPGWPVPLNENSSRDLYMSLSTVQQQTSEHADNRIKTASTEDLSLDIADDIDQELLDAFLFEAPGNTQQFNMCIMNIVNHENLADNISHAQRIAHTLKGAANMVGIPGIANLTHHLEDILEYMINRQIVPPAPLLDMLQESADCLESMLEVIQGTGLPPQNAMTVYQRILDWANRFDQGQIRADDTDYVAFADITEKDTADVIDSDSPDAIAAAVKNNEVMRVPVETVDSILQLIEEESISLGQTQERLNRISLWKEQIKNQNEIIQQRRYEFEDLISIRGHSTVRRVASMGHASNTQFDSLEMDEYDDLYSSAQAYIEAITDSHEMFKNVQNEIEELERLTLQHQRMNKELQRVIMTTRMIKVDTLNARLHRTVRQACRITGKQVELTIHGADILIDTDMLNKVADPLMHLLRNAIDHGIETAEERHQQGKNSAGNVTVSFSKFGNYVLIECADDGRGLNYEAIQQTAERKGILEPGVILDENYIARLILIPGFSTRSTTTQISGRGIGMDVVDKTIKELKGSLDIRSGDNGGTVFSIRLPVTLIAYHSLVVESDGTQYVIPTDSLEQIIAPGMGELQIEDGIAIYQYNDEIYQAHNLVSLVSQTHTYVDNTMMVLMVRTEYGIKAVLVNTIIGGFDLVVKNTGNYVKNVRGINGVTLLGDGRVIPVLDLPILLSDRSVNSTPALIQTDRIETSTSRVPAILIADDSLSVRTTLSQLVQDAGYKPLLARDGLDATEVMENNTVDAALIDMEMPHMNGLDLTRYIKNNFKTNPIPVIMITSRSQAKHRSQAQQAGVDEYLTKPYSEEELLEVLDRQLAVAGSTVSM